MSVVLLLCALLYTARIPIDEALHWEIRVRLCTHAREPHISVDTRTYQRVLGWDRYRYSRNGQEEYDAPQESWWTTEQNILLHVVPAAK